MKGLGLTVFVAVILIGALGALFLEDVLITPTEIQQPASNAPTYYFEDFTMRVMDEEGRLAYVLVGDNLLGYKDDEVDARIESPQLAIDTASQPPWDITANAGDVTQGGDLVMLRGNVVLQQVGAQAVPPLRIETETLDVHTKDRVASTADPVNITAPQWQVRSVGMHARFDEGLVDLLASVHGRYKPPVIGP